MKLSKISMGVAALCGLAAAPAYAITAAGYTPGNAMRIYVSGATAMDVGLANATIAMCVAGTVNQYTISNQSVWLCTPDTTKITGTAGRQLAVHKHSPGGSGNGVAPVNNSTPLPFLDLSLINSNCANATNAGTIISCTGASGPVTANSVAPLGISDVEPSFFGAAAGTFNNLSVQPLATVIFGLPVTTTAYTALQVAQSLTSTGAAATEAANIPSLTTAQITSMFTQEGQSWLSLTGATLADDTVYVARRADSSGTQKTYEAVIARTANGVLAGKSCNANLPSFLSGPDAVAANVASLCDGSNLIVNNSGSSQVTACLTALNSATKGAIGTLTTEQISDGNWKHVRVNGLLPNYANVKSGAYTNYGDSTLNSRISPAIGTDHQAYRTAFRALFADVAILHPAFGDVTTDAGKAGLIGLKTLTGVATDNPWVRTNASGSTDNCRPARQGGF